MTRRRPPALEPEDRALWDVVKKSVKPLQPPIVKAEEPPPLAPPQRTKSPARRAATAPAEPSKPKAPPPLALLDRRTRSRIVRGRVEIDARLDLHGLTLERARTRLESFLSGAQSRGHALVLVITGKGRGQGEGAIRREVPHWLSLPSLRPLVLGFEEAAPSHGGSGALYVRMRRSR